jgi:hypothetical protein
VPGAGDETRRVKILNANWLPADDDGGGQFDILMITEDDQHYAVPASPASMTALVALATADTVLAWDPTNRALIVANIVGTMPWTTTSSRDSHGRQRVVLSTHRSVRRACSTTRLAKRLLSVAMAHGPIYKERKETVRESRTLARWYCSRIRSLRRRSARGPDP